ncbi:uncharacterized protein LOC141898927 [Tubulanus polymorphus]|uniref:uncharacterized protein LOC141898927 n=1 Tax=Tubulanus polymorphus TaxID=672921 RepID=UPI003DA5F6E7
MWSDSQSVLYRISTEKPLNLHSNSLWWHGPKWLVSGSHPTWSPYSAFISAMEVGTDVNSVKGAVPREKVGVTEIVDATRMSSLRKLLRVTAWVRRIIDNTRGGQVKVKTPIIRQLQLYMDVEGLIRSRGRIDNADIASSTKYPCLLPKLHAFSNLVIKDAHEKVFHLGVNSTVSYIRQMYWIPCIRQLVKSRLRQCVICRRFNSRPFRFPDPPPLPVNRVARVPAFFYTGLDYAGPFNVRTPSTIGKAYICLFTCSVSRGVHLEAKEFISQNGVSWNFIPKRAPWVGGYWEGLVGVVKSVLKKIVGRALLTIDEFRTVITEVESVVNDRPLTYLSSDPSDENPLTPSQLMVGRRVTSLPHSYVAPGELEDPDFELKPCVAESRSKHLSVIMQHFSNRWAREYLASLREYYQQKAGKNELFISRGDVVLIEDEEPRSKWQMGVVTDLHYGRDSLVRFVSLRTKNGSTNRSISKLYPLEVREATKGDVSRPQSGRDAEVDDSDAEVLLSRLPRGAATKARDKIRRIAHDEESEEDD